MDAVSVVDRPLDSLSPDAAPGQGQPLDAAPLTPIGADERLSSVDIVRGVAVLGILLMNIPGFAFHIGALGDPSVAGGATGLNFWVFALNAVLVDGKMRGIFSLCFGAGVVILTTRAAQRGAAADAADIHYRRMMWLMLFGIIHAYFLWWGDILYPYAMLGFLLYPLRRVSPRALTITGVVLIVLLTLMAVGQGRRVSGMRDEAAKADAAQARGETLTDEQRDAQRGWTEHLKNVKPDAKELARVNAAFGGSWLDALKERAKLVAQFHFTPYYFPVLWDMLAMMLFGMAMLKAGILSAQRSFAFYTKMAFAAYAIGLPLSIFMVQQIAAANFDHLTMVSSFALYEAARIAVCFGHVAVIMMIVKAGALRALTSPLAAVGQTAFSNYILQSIICSTVFYGYGFGLFGKLQRYEIYYVVLGCWVLALIWSPLWLRRYRFGPLEWCWRSLTYWKRQPMSASTPLAA